LANFFWKHFTKEYLSSLIERKKWEEKKVKLKEGDVALAAEPNQLRGVRLLERIVSTHLGQDGKVSGHGSYPLWGVQKTNHETVFVRGSRGLEN